ncbi:retrovirus-related Pol polyprotein from transposon 297 [Trichonephila clavipes]|nr:retrovirus-related Pol polyprotein from transposon 297 [Trichonephila clavipes]
MPFGLSGMAPNFQYAIDIILKQVIGRFVMVYMYNVFITSVSFNEHIDHLNEVFTLLRDAGLTLNKDKSHFARAKLKHLGLIIKAPVLQLPNFQEQFNLFTDASGVGISAVLNQNHRPIAFASRTLNQAERNYTVIERESVTVIWALNKSKNYFGSLPVKEHRSDVRNVVSDVLPRISVGNMYGSQISCAALRALALNSREQLIREQREDHELGHMYRYLEKPEDGSVNATVCEGDKENSSILYISSRNHKYRRPNNPSQEPQFIAGPSHQIDTRQCKRPTEGSRLRASVQYDRARENRTTSSEGNSAAERIPVRSRQATAVRPCPYNLRSRLKKPEGIPEEQRSNGIDSIPQNNLRRRSLCMEALDEDPVDMSE